MLYASNPVENDLNSFINTSRLQRTQSMTTYTPRIMSYPNAGNFDTQSELQFDRSPPVRALSPEDLQKLKYKIDLDKQVAEKKERRVREWESKIERDRKYVQNQPFGKHSNTTFINQQELEDILNKGRAPSPSIDMPQQLPLNYPSSRGTSSSQQPTYNNYPTSGSSQRNDITMNTNGDFQKFYGPIGSGGNMLQQSTSSSTTSQPIKGDAHDPFLLFDPNKEGQNVFNIIPQQDLYDPWGRPGGGAPLVHPPTGQKFTRYSGSLEEKLTTPGPLGFHRRQYNGRLEEQKRDLELEQQRRQQEDREHRSNAGDTADWINSLESTRFPLRLHLPTTRTTREYIGVRDPNQIHESRVLHTQLVQQAEERARNHQMNRYQDNVAELQHTETQNGWWGRSGGGAPIYNSRRHNVLNTFENPRQQWTTNHLGQLIMADAEPPNQVKMYQSDYYFPKTTRSSNHRNYYEFPDSQKS